MTASKDNAQLARLQHTCTLCGGFTMNTDTGVCDACVRHPAGRPWQGGMLPRGTRLVVAQAPCDCEGGPKVCDVCLAVDMAAKARQARGL